ncbi:MAG: peptidylprolyl isomerase [Trueperaceae bacterium]
MTYHRPARVDRALLLALGLFALLVPTPASAQDVAPSGDGDPVLLSVGATVERWSDLSWRFDVAARSVAAQQGMPYDEAFAEQMRSFLPVYLEQRAQEVVLLVEARRRGFEADEATVQATIDRIRGGVPEGESYEQALVDAGFGDEQHLRTMIEEGEVLNQLMAAVDADVDLSDDAVTVRYLAERPNLTEAESFCARHILVEDEELAAQLVADIADGEDFATLAAEHGTDGTASRGGDLGCFGRGSMVAPFEEAVVAAPVGTAVGPVETQFGYHVVLVYEHRPASVRAFDDVSGQVRDYARSLESDAVVRGMMRGAGAITYPENLPASPDQP